VILYLDTSALLKRYVQEVGSAWLTVQCDPVQGNSLVTALITKFAHIGVIAVQGATLRDIAIGDLRFSILA
jgi:hypothetical protein